MKYFLLAVFVLLLSGSCSHKEKLPPDIFPVDKMKIIVWEMEVADQVASEHFLMQKDSLRMESTSLYQQVFTKQKTDKKTFYKSFSFYEAHPELLKILFDSVNNYGGRQKNAIFKKMR